jgi:S-adenosylmethionine/arginine decarboxylase-like enzyme
MLSCNRAIAVAGRLGRTIRMHLITDPLIYECKDGYSIILIIVESHIAVHTEGEFINIDIFSCKDFDSEKAAAFCIDNFNIIDIINQGMIYRKFGGRI